MFHYMAHLLWLTRLFWWVRWVYSLGWSSPPLPSQLLSFQSELPIAHQSSEQSAFQRAAQQCADHSDRAPPCPQCLVLPAFLATKTLLFSKSPLLATLVSDHTSSCPHYRKIWSNMYFSIKYHPKFCHCLHSDIMKVCFHKRYKFTFWVKSADHPQRVWKFLFQDISILFWSSFAEKFEVQFSTNTTPIDNIPWSLFSVAFLCDCLLYLDISPLGKQMLGNMSPGAASAPLLPCLFAKICTEIHKHGSNTNPNIHKFTNIKVQQVPKI